MSEFWRQGYGTEMARAGVEVAFDRLEVETVACWTLPINAASQRLMAGAMRVTRFDLSPPPWRG